MSSAATLTTALHEHGALVATAAALALAYVIVRYRSSPWRKLPPGPPGLPVLGHLLHLRDKQWITFMKWRETYGDIMTLNAAGQPLIVISDLKKAADLLDRRAANYSERPRNIVASEIMTGGLFLTFQNHTDPLWRRLRRAGHEGLNNGVAHRYFDIQTVEGLILATAVLRTPGAFDMHLRRTGASMVMTMVYGLDPVMSEEDPEVVAINESANRQTTAALPGNYWVEFFPWMKHIPSSLAPWKKYAEDSFIQDAQTFDSMFDDVHKRVANGQQRESLAATLIQEGPRLGLSKRESAFLAANMFTAGTDAGAAVMSWWLFAMILNPEVQRKAQLEVDTVVGRDRVPTFADMEHMPYVRAMVKETLRWRPVDPLGIPHRVLEDDFYDGYFIPKDAIIIPLVWAMNRDPALHGEDADQFNPARHLDENGKMKIVPDTKEENHLAYGFGRRLCLGRFVANNQMFIQMALLLWCVNVEQATDEKGNKIPLDIEGAYENGLAVRPMPFQCKFTPRFEGALEMLEAELEARQVEMK